MNTDHMILFIREP